MMFSWFLCQLGFEAVVVAVFLAEVASVTEEQRVYLGVYGAMTTAANSALLAATVAADIDFRKNHNATLRNRFGPPAIEVPNLLPGLRINPLIGNSFGQVDIGVGSALNFMLGQNSIPKVHGLVGGGLSSISTKIAANGAAMEVPQVAYGSTSAELSNKQVYGYFMRTCPTDSVVGRGLWRYLKFFGFRSATVLYTDEPYGQGIFNTVKELATDANAPDSIHGAAMMYMPEVYEPDKVEQTLDRVAANGDRLVFMVVAFAMLDAVWPQMQKFGFFSGAYQVVGTNFGLWRGKSQIPNNFAVEGLHSIAAKSEGAQYSGFSKLWSQMNASDILLEQERFRLDSWGIASPTTPFKADDVDPSWFVANPSDIAWILPFAFDAIYTFIFALNGLAQQNLTIDEMRGKPLLDALRATKFNGVTGPVAFDDHGDRLGNYELMHMEVEADGKGKYVAAGIFDAAENTYTMEKDLVWMITMTTGQETNAGMDPAMIIVIVCTLLFGTGGLAACAVWWIFSRKREVAASPKSTCRLSGGSAENTNPPVGNGAEQEPDTSVMDTQATEAIFEYDNISAVLRTGLSEHWFIEPQHIKFEEGEISSGSYGSIRKGLLLDSTEIAIKVPKNGNVHDIVETQSIINEMRLFRRIRHPNVVLFHGATISRMDSALQLCLVLEWIDGGDLGGYVRGRRNNGEFNKSCLEYEENPQFVVPEVKILLDVARGMRYLHGQKPPILHRDLKPGNVLIETSEPPRAKLADFGLSVLLQGDDPSARAGTKRYMAPEVAEKGACYNTAADVFSYGCVCYFIMHAEHPDPSTVSDTLIPKDNFACLRLVLEVAQQCLQLDPQNRLQLSEVFQALNSACGFVVQDGTSTPGIRSAISASNAITL